MFLRLNVCVFVKHLCTKISCLRTGRSTV